MNLILRDLFNRPERARNGNPWVSGARRLRSLLWAGLGTAIAWTTLAPLPSAHGQEIVRATPEALPVQTFRAAPEEFFRLGPFQEELTGTGGVSYTDNIDLTPNNKISDLAFTEGLSLHTTWVISHFNKLEFDFGGSLIENFYGNGRTKINFAADPDSKIEFKFAVGTDTTVRLYDNFAYTQNPTTDPTATNTANLNSLSNTIGASIDQDFRIATLSFLAEYGYNNESGENSNNQDNPNTTGSRSTFRAGPSITFRLTPAILYGLDAIATRSSGTDAANVNTLNIGPFIKGKLGKNIDFAADAGISFIDTKPSIPTGYYASGTIRYQLTHHTQLEFSASHNLIFTTSTDLTNQNLISLGAQTNLTRTLSVSFSPFVNFGEVLTQGGSNVGSTEGPYTLFGADVGITWKPRKRWTASINYDYTRRESAATFTLFGQTASSNYIVNTWTFALHYAF
jgi:hypothetical protein